MLPQQILPVVVSVWRSHNAVNVLPGGLHRIGRKFSQVGRSLVVKFNQNHWTLNTVIKHTVRLRASDPGKPGVIKMPIHVIHLYARMAIVHVAHVELN